MCPAHGPREERVAMENLIKDDELKLTIAATRDTSPDSGSLREWPTGKEIWAELQKQKSIGFPVAVMNVLWFARFIVSTIFLGRLGSLELAGGTMALTFANVTGFSILMGLAGGMEPICSQAYGARRYKLMGLTLQRCVLILLLTSVPISLIWWNVEGLLMALGQDRAIAVAARQYLRYLFPDLYATAVVTPLRIFLRSQCITTPMMVCSGVALLLHVPINYLIVYSLQLGAPGTALANFFADVNLIVLLFLYAWRTGMCATSWPGWSRACLVEWTPLLRLAIPSCLMTCLEWWCYEILMVLAGLLPHAHECVATMAIVINGDSILYALQLGLASCVCTRVGNELGANRPLRAYHASIAALSLSACLGCFGAVCLISERFVWGKLFTSDALILVGVSQILPLMGLCELGNFPQTVACGILRGSARPSTGACINLGSFYLIGLPVSILLAFVFKLGLLGLWLGLLAAVSTCAALTVASIVRTDWVKMAARAQEANSDHVVDAASPRSCDVNSEEEEAMPSASTEKEVLLLKRMQHHAEDRCVGGASDAAPASRHAASSGCS